MATNSPIVQEDNGDYWCIEHDCSAYECACVWLGYDQRHTPIDCAYMDKGECMCDACQSIAHAEMDVLAGLTPEQQLHVYNLVEQCGWDIDKALALYR